MVVYGDSLRSVLHCMREQQKDMSRMSLSKLSRVQLLLVAE